MFLKRTQIIIILKVNTSKILFSQCVRAVPSSPWSSSSAPSKYEQLKCFLTSSTTLGVTII